MRTLLLGTDFVYNSNGDLVPIEINTNIDIDTMCVLESIGDFFNLDELELFINNNGFTKISYVGSIHYLNTILKELTVKLNISYRWYIVSTGGVVPDLEDSPEHLIIRSAYDYSALVDYVYCRDKVSFMNLIRIQTFGTEFAYMNEDNQIINYITEIPDYGDHPNFILKCVLPNYDRTIYPKFFRVTNQEELNTVIQNNVNQSYFLMKFHLNFDKLYQGNVKVIRSMNLLFPPNLDNLSIGQFTRLNNRNVNDSSDFDAITFELLNSEDRIKYVSDTTPMGPKLLDTDRVELADGTFQTALNLQVGDMLKTIIIPNPNNVDITRMVFDYEIDYETLVSGTTYSQNEITNKAKVDRLVDYVKINFTDDTDWEDTESSSYLILRDNMVYFRYLNYEDQEYGIKIGDDIILIDTSDDINVNFILKKITTIEKTRQIFSGWVIGVAERHLFLTQDGAVSDDNISYVAVEHNASNCPAGGYCTHNGCTKSEWCCGASATPTCLTTSCSCNETIPPT